MSGHRVDVQGFSTLSAIRHVYDGTGPPVVVIVSTDKTCAVPAMRLDARRLRTMCTTTTIRAQMRRIPTGIPIAGYPKSLATTQPTAVPQPGQWIPTG